MEFRVERRPAGKQKTLLTRVSRVQKVFRSLPAYLRLIGIVADANGRRGPREAEHPNLVATDTSRRGDPLRQRLQAGIVRAGFHFIDERDDCTAAFAESTYTLAGEAIFNLNIRIDG